MLTLAHELAHLWLGQSGLSNPQIIEMSVHATQSWCNTAAAELLAPKEEFLATARKDETLENALPRLARHFKVRTLVVLRRMLDVQWLSPQEFWRAYRAEEIDLKISLLAALAAETSTERHPRAPAGDLLSL